MSKRKVGYLYNNNIGSFYYGEQHPMKPIIIKMTHQKKLIQIEEC